MSNNYPPGVTGAELPISGPDYERETTCSVCGADAMEYGHRYSGQRWTDCENDHLVDLDPEEHEPDPDRYIEYD